MTHRFLHLGDLHLGPNDRNADRIAALDQAIREGLAQPLAAWLWPGDLNHGKMTIHDKNVLTARVQQMAYHAPVVICYGNHDEPGDLDFLARLDSKCGIFVIDRPEVIYFASGSDRVACFVLPYPHRAGFVAAGIESQGVVGAAREALDIIFMDAAKKLEDAERGGCIPLMIGHVNVAGSIASTGQPQIGQEIELDAALLQRLRVGYVGLNHIHKAQYIGGARYAGSMCRLDWGEADPKSYLLLTVGKGDEMQEGASDADGWLFHIDLCPLDIAPMYKVEGRLTRDGFVWGLAGSTTAGPLDTVFPEIPASFEGAEVRVRYRFVAAELDALDVSQVRVPFLGAKKLTIEPVAEHTRAIRAPEVAQARTLDEKVRTVIEQAGLTWSDGIEEKLALLQQAAPLPPFVASETRQAVCQ